MKFMHRVALDSSIEARKKLEEQGVKFNDDGDIIYLDISEDNKNWEFINNLYNKYQNTYGITSVPGVTIFSKKELASASLYYLNFNWDHGYAQPDCDHDEDDEDDEYPGYLKVTYDITNCCRGCNRGKKQKAPFLFLKEPRWGKKSILQLHAPGDEFFTLPEVWESVFKPFGIECMPVLKLSSKKELKTVVQLKVKDESPYELDMLNHPYVDYKKKSAVCSDCKKVKYHYHYRGPFPSLKMPKGSKLPYIFKTKEYFGYGGAAGKSILIVKELYEKMKDLKGVQFYPLIES